MTAQEVLQAIADIRATEVSLGASYDQVLAVAGEARGPKEVLLAGKPIIIDAVITGTAQATIGTGPTARPDYSKQVYTIAHGQLKTTDNQTFTAVRSSFKSTPNAFKEGDKVKVKLMELRREPSEDEAKAIQAGTFKGVVVGTGAETRVLDNYWQVQK